MIKWLICFFLGHDIDMSITRKLEIFRDEGGENEIYPQALCKRCKKFRTL
jgi:hypothetical protein